MIQWQIRDAAGHAVWQIHWPVEVPEAIDLRNGKWVRFVGENALQFELAVKVAQQEQANLQLHVALQDANGQTLDEATPSPQHEKYHATLNLTDCPPQLYRLAISLVDEQGKAVLSAEQPVMVVPHYGQD